MLKTLAPRHDVDDQELVPSHSAIIVLPCEVGQKCVQTVVHGTKPKLGRNLSSHDLTVFNSNTFSKTEGTVVATAASQSKRQWSDLANGVISNPGAMKPST